MQTLHSVPEAANWLHANVTGELRTDSRMVQPGDAFIAWPGAATDGRQYLAQALQKGAAVCLMEAQEHEVWGRSLPGEMLRLMATMPELKVKTGLIADAYYEHPSQVMCVLAVTGTNGKTSTTWWLAQALSSSVLRKICALVGSLGVGQLNALVPTGMTTPDPVFLQRQFREFIDAGVTHCAIEASSIGLAEHRLSGTNIRVAIFTNFTQDHLDYHGDMDHYWLAKQTLFGWPGLQAAVINIDDPHGAMLAQHLSAHALDVWTCSRQGAARLQARVLRHVDGLSFEVNEGGDLQTLHTGLMGDFNIDNLLGVIGSLRALDVSLADAVQACRHLTAVPGRMQRVHAGEGAGAGAQNLPLVVVDYAHTPDAVSHALTALRSQAVARGGRLWCVLGCGGDRDAGKRPLMAAAAQAAADHVLLTSDNPRSESPQAILAEMVVGFGDTAQARVQADRALAIAEVVAQAAAKDVILVAGKGHETEQEIMGVRHPFSDVLHVQAALQRRVAQQQGGVA